MKKEYRGTVIQTDSVILTFTECKKKKFYNAKRLNISTEKLVGLVREKAEMGRFIRRLKTAEAGIHTEDKLNFLRINPLRGASLKFERGFAVICGRGKDIGVSQIFMNDKLKQDRMNVLDLPEPSKSTFIDYSLKED